MKCAICGGKYEILAEASGAFLKDDVEMLHRCRCKKCGFMTSWRSDKLQALMLWNEDMKKIANGEYPEVVKYFKEKMKDERKIIKVCR